MKLINELKQMNEMISDIEVDSQRVYNAVAGRAAAAGPLRAIR